MSTPGQDERDSLSQKRRREGVVKSDKHCNLTLKAETQSFQDQCYVSQKYHCGISTGICCSTSEPLEGSMYICK